MRGVSNMAGLDTPPQTIVTYGSSEDLGSHVRLTLERKCVGHYAKSFQETGVSTGCGLRK